MVEKYMVPRPRSRLPVMCAVVLSSLALMVTWFLDSMLMRQISISVVFALSLGTVLHNLCLLTEEWIFHSNQRYSGSIKQMFWACFSSATVLGVGVVILLLVVEGSEWQQQRWVLCVIISAFYLLLKNLGVLGPARVEILEVCENRKLNVAHGLAWSFYLGYLKLVIPELEEQLKKHYNQTEEVLHSLRLHILLPLSAVVPAKLEEEDNNILFHKNLPEVLLDRAGVRKRVYKNSIYKITDHNDKPYFCVAEYATPLLTLYQMSQDSTAGFSEQDRRQQVLLFYRTLSDILESSLECRNRYRLILLDDKQADGDPHYLSTEIIKHLQQQEHEIPMYLPEILPKPVPEHGMNAIPLHFQQEEPLSSLPSLMISTPLSLRADPVENTDYTQNNYRHNGLH